MRIVKWIKDIMVLSVEVMVYLFGIGVMIVLKVLYKGGKR